jgi:hypothetical protein
MKITIQQQQDSSLFSVEWGEQRPLPPAHASVAPPETPRRLAVDNKCYLRRVSGGGRGTVWCRVGAIRGSTVWGAKLGSDGSPRGGRRVKGQSRGTAWRVIGISGCAGAKCPIFGHPRGPRLHRPNQIRWLGRLTGDSPYTYRPFRGDLGLRRDAYQLMKGNP